MGNLNPIPNPAYTPTSTHNTDTFSPRSHLYNDPTGINGAPVQSTVGPQAEQAFYLKKAIVEAARQRKFSPMASVEYMPKHMGKRIRAWVHYPLLDDRNLNDQGINARGVQIKNGNLYGSSDDIGSIQEKIPVIQEIGGRVNRVGFSRAQVEGTFNQFGFFYEYSKDSLDFDSDPQLASSMYKRALEGAEKITEDMLQIDLLNGAGTLIYSGSATSEATMDNTSLVSYGTLQRLNRALDSNRTPKSTKIIKGSQNFDTRTLTSHRVLFVGSDMLTYLETLRDPFGNPAFIPTHQYAAATSVMTDEVGTIAGFRVIQCEEMKCWRGKGATGANSHPEIRSTDDKYDIYPMLCIGSEAFTTIGFQGSNGVNNKFEIHNVKPQVTRDDPYGKIGFVSLQWKYGVMFLRPERIGLIKTVCPL